jgi:hypothetical protein
VTRRRSQDGLEGMGGGVGVVERIAVNSWDCLSVAHRLSTLTRVREPALRGGVGESDC